MKNSFKILFVFGLLLTAALKGKATDMPDARFTIKAMIEGLNDGAKVCLVIMKNNPVIENRYMLPLSDTVADEYAKHGTIAFNGIVNVPGNLFALHIADRITNLYLLLSSGEHVIIKGTVAAWSNVR